MAVKERQGLEAGEEMRVGSPQTAACNDERPRCGNYLGFTANVGTNPEKESARASRVPTAHSSLSPPSPAGVLIRGHHA